MSSMHRKFSLVFLFGLFIIFRSASLTRDLAFEEATYLLPGRSLIEGHGYMAYLGELSKNFTPFHKPPLASLFPGFFSYLSFDWVHAGRLFSLLISLWICFIGVIFFDSSLVSLVAILSPFLLAAATHIQTDPTVGLLGVSLVAVSFLPGSDNNRFNLFFLIGIVVLWCGKVELAICTTFALVLAGVFFSAFRNKKFFRDLFLASALGVLSVFCLSGFLALTRGEPFASAFLGTLGVMTGITSNVTEGIVHKAAQMNRVGILSDLRHQKFFHLILVCFIPSLFALHRNLLSKKDRHHMGLLSLISAVIFFVYFLGGWRGDGFPRYFLGSIPPALCILGLSLQRIHAVFPKNNWKYVFGILVILLFLPRSLQHLKTPYGITGLGFTTGYRESAEIVKAFTQEGDLIVVPEPSIVYLENRKWLVDSTYCPYPDSYPRALEFSNQIRAAITDARPLNPNTPYDYFMAKLLKPLIDQGAISLFVGTFQIFVLPPKVHRN